MEKKFVVLCIFRWISKLKKYFQIRFFALNLQPLELKIVNNSLNFILLTHLGVRLFYLLMKSQ